MQFNVDVNIHLELDILKLFQTREYYDKYVYFIKWNTLSQKCKKILNTYKTYYELYDGDITSDKFTSYFLSQNQNLLDDEIVEYKTIFNRLHNLDNPTLQTTLQQWKKEELWQKICYIHDTSFNIEELKETVDNFEDTAELDDDVLPDFEEDWDALIQQDKQGGYKWRINQLNSQIGALKRGFFYLVMATTHTGKTSFVISETANMLKQLKDQSSLCYFNNEMPEESIFLRYLSGLFNVDKSTVQHDLLDIKQAYNDYFNNDSPLKIYSARNGKASRKRIEKVCKHYKPHIIILDQVDKLKGSMDNSRRPYEGLYTWCRNIAVNYNIAVIGVTQRLPKKDKYGNEVFGRVSQFDTFDASTDKAGNSDYLLALENEEYDDNRKNLYILRAKDGNEGKKIKLFFNRSTGIYTD